MDFNLILMENDIKSFVYHWFAGFDRMENTSYFAKYLPEESFELNYLGTIIRSKSEFANWLKSVHETINSNSHKIERLNIRAIENQKWTVEVDLKWIAERKDTEHLDLPINQIWEVKSGEGDQFIITKISATLINKIYQESSENLKDIYGRLCIGYHEVDNFRSKLLGFLPFATGAAIFGVMNYAKEVPGKVNLSKVGIFGALVTIGLLIYELKGIQKCTGYIFNGAAIEKKLLGKSSKLNGMFRSMIGHSKTDWLISEPMASALIYSTVIGAWLYLTKIGSFAIDIGVLIFFGSILFWRFCIINHNAKTLD